jgi:hypothetical protein
MAKRVSKERRLAREWVERRTALLQRMEDRAQHRGSRRDDEPIGEIVPMLGAATISPRKTKEARCLKR